MSRKSADSYGASIERLKVLVNRLESAEVDVDELEAVVKESVALVAVCRTRLRATQGSVDTLLAGLEDVAPVNLPHAATPAQAVVPIETDPFADE